MLKNANEISKEVFGGKISPWQVLYYTRKGKIPCITIGRRKFFEVNKVLQAMRPDADINNKFKRGVN